MRTDTNAYIKLHNHNLDIPKVKEEIAERRALRNQKRDEVNVTGCKLQDLQMAIAKTKMEQEEARREEAFLREQVQGAKENGMALERKLQETLEELQELQMVVAEDKLD